MSTFIFDLSFKFQIKSNQADANVGDNLNLVKKMMKPSKQLNGYQKSDPELEEQSYSDVKRISFKYPKQDQGLKTIMKPGKQLRDHQNGDPELEESHSNIKKMSFKYPKQDQALIINVVDNASIKDYIFAISKLVRPKNIIAGSRLSHKQICIFLSEKYLVDEILNRHITVKIKGQYSHISRLISPSKKVILSNVSPTIPNEVLLKSLELHNVKVTSPIYLIKAGFSEEKYSHIISFRRYVYVTGRNALPKCILVDHDGDTYHVHLHLDELISYKCHDTKDNSRTTMNSPKTSKVINEISQNRKKSVSLQIPCAEPTKLNESVSEQDLFPTFISSDESSTNTSLTMEMSAAEHDNELTLDELLKPIKTAINKNSETYSFNYEQFKKLFLQMEESESPQIILENFSYDVNYMVKILKNFYDLLTFEIIKHRFLTIIDKIKKQEHFIDNLSSGSESDLRASID